MTREAVIKVVQRAVSDGAFRTQLSRDAATALRGFDLTPAEVSAIRSGDSGRISALGVDLRMSKVFTLAGTDGRADSVLTTGTDSSLTSGVNSSLTSGADAAIQSGTDSSLTAGANTSVNSVDTIDAGSMGSAAQTGESAGTQVVQWDGNDDAPLGTVIPGEPAHAFGAQMPEGGAFGDNTLTAGDEGYLPSVGFAETSQGGTQASSAGFATDEGQLTNDLNSSASAGEGGAGTGAEAHDGPEIQP